jgi:hypothetical protein
LSLRIPLINAAAVPKAAAFAFAGEQGDPNANCDGDRN